MNPGGSVKDRAALQIIKDAIKEKIQKGGIIVEGTEIPVLDFAWSEFLGMKSKIVIPETQSEEKKQMLKYVVLI